MRAPYLESTKKMYRGVAEVGEEVNGVQQRRRYSQKHTQYGFQDPEKGDPNELPEEEQANPDVSEGSADVGPPLHSCFSVNPALCGFE